MSHRSRDVAHGCAAIAEVRSTFWLDLDAANLVVMVGDAQHLSLETIDQDCLELEPIGDTHAGIVNMRGVTAKTPDGATTLSRNCQLSEGQRVLLQVQLARRRRGSSSSGSMRGNELSLINGVERDASPPISTGFRSDVHVKILCIAKGAVVGQKIFV